MTSSATLAVLFIAAASVAGCESPPARISPPVATSHRVKFRISGTAKSVLLTIQMPDGGTKQGYTTMKKLRSVEMDGKAAVLSDNYPPGSFAYLSLQNQDEAGSVKIELFIDDLKIQESSTMAAYGIASVSASVPR